jgi:ABC-2 type transport system ATP-binding protein
MPRPIVEFQHVTKVYRAGLLRRKSIHALRDVTLAVARGSVFGLIGPNRAGKTTLVKTLLSICRPTAGTILRLGYPAHDRTTLAAVGYLHESQAFPSYLSARSLLEYYGSLSQVSRDELHRRIPRLLDQVGLADRAAEPISTFSKGMVQRLALAQSLVNDPQLLVLDEPSEGMDLVARRLLYDVIRRCKQEEKTVILVSHNVADIQRLCDEVALLRDGSVSFAGSLTQLAGEDQWNASTDALLGVLEPMYTGATT